MYYMISEDEIISHQRCSEAAVQDQDNRKINHVKLQIMVADIEYPQHYFYMCSCRNPKLKIAVP